MPDGEVHTVRWKDIDGESWTIPADFAENKLSHMVPLSPQSLRILEQVRKVMEAQDEKVERPGSEWGFPNPIRRVDHINECQKLARRVREESKVLTSGRMIFVAHPIQAEGSGLRAPRAPDRR